MDKKSTSAASQIVNSPMAPSGKSNKIKFLIALILLILLGLGAWLWLKDKNSSNNQKSTSSVYSADYNINEMSSFRVADSHASFAFLKPAEMRNIYKSIKYNSSEFGQLVATDFDHAVTSRDPKYKTVNIASLSVAMSKAPIPLSEAINISDALLAGTGAKYKTQAKILRDFVSTGIKAPSKVNFGACKDFVNANITDGAWQCDTSVVEPESVYNRQGKIIFAIGERAIYYFSFLANTNNWQNNQAIWQKMFNSLAIDLKPF